MVRLSFIGLAIALSLPLALAKDFCRNYTLPQGGQIIIENILGDITVIGEKRNDIEVVASKRGVDSDSIEILDTSMGNRVEIHVRPAQFQRADASVELEIRVPDSIEYNFTRLSSFSGTVEVSDVIGRLRAESIRGNVELNDVRGMVSASSFSGNIKIAIDKDHERSNMRFSSISGDIDISAPSDLDALIEMSTASGMLKTDFPLEIRESRYGPGRSASGRLGTGKQILRIRSVTGRVLLHQK
jgi:DUF4097 and DUF4098 domain-containing protein YvlB